MSHDDALMCDLIEKLKVENVQLRGQLEYCHNLLNEYEDLYGLLGTDPDA